MKKNYQKSIVQLFTLILGMLIITGAIIYFSKNQAAAIPQPIYTTPSPNQYPTPSIAQNNEIVVTTADNGKTIQARVGNRITIRLGNDQNWDLQPYDTRILQAAPNGVFYMKGQSPTALLRAIAPGTAKISAIGTAICAGGAACPQYAISFQTTILVLP